MADPASLSDAKWLARFGFRAGAGGYLDELDPSRCADWLTGFLAERGGAVPGTDVRAAAAAALPARVAIAPRARVA